METGDRVKIKIPYGFWKSGHTGRIYAVGFHGDKKYDYAVLLDGDFSCSGFNENEIEKEGAK